MTVITGIKQNDRKIICCLVSTYKEFGKVDQLFDEDFSRTRLLPCRLYPPVLPFDAIVL